MHTLNQHKSNIRDIAYSHSPTHMYVVPKVFIVKYINSIKRTQFLIYIQSPRWQNIQGDETTPLIM